MNFLVLGGSGFIGRQLVHQLAQNGHFVRVYDWLPFPDGLTCSEYFRAFIEDVNTLQRALSGVEVVYHLVCTMHPKTSNDHPIYDVESNVVNTLGVLQACRDAGIRRFVFISSGGTVYGVPQMLPIEETHPTEPICSYGITKLMIEKYLHLYHVLYGLDYMILRTANVYGEGQDPHQGQGAVAAFLGCISQGRSIEVWGDGSVIRDYIHVEDIARALLMAAEQTPKDRILNVGSATGISLKELIHLIKGITGKEITVNYGPGRPFDIPEVVLDTRRIREQMGWQPKVMIHDGLERTWRWLKDRKG